MEGVDEMSKTYSVDEEFEVTMKIKVRIGDIINWNNYDPKEDIENGRFSINDIKSEIIEDIKENIKSHGCDMKDISEHVEGVFYKVSEVSGVLMICH